jgi:DnaJ-domain-containing protein 1
VLEAYLDRRLGPDWRTAQASGEAPPPRSPRSDMSRDEALAVLGLNEGATPDEIKAAHRRLIQRVHPDVGGSADLAARINRAKDILLGGR